MILAHRGDSYRAPENTIEAARLGFEAHADAWELDVWMTRDGRLVVLHDESLERTTDVSQKFAGDPRADSSYLIRDFLFDEVMTLDAGSWFVDPAGGSRSARGFGTLANLSDETVHHYQSGSVRIPSLRSALQFTAERNGMINIEIKADPKRRELVVRALIDEVIETGMIANVTVSSFDHGSVAMVSNLEPRMATGLLLSGRVDEGGKALLEKSGADALHVSVEACLDADGLDLGSLLAWDRRTSIPLLVYTVNDARPSGLASRLAEAGVTGLFTDDPASFRDRFGPTLTRS